MKGRGSRREMAPGGLLLTWLALALNFFGYCVIALFFATLGRSAAARLDFALGFFIAENLLQGILVAISLLFQQTQLNVAEFIRHIPDWFLGTNLGYIVQHASLSPSARPAIRVSQGSARAMRCSWRYSIWWSPSAAAI